MPDLSDFTLYHRAVRDVRGEYLLPLNALRDSHPDVYEREVAKYAGREALRDSIIPELNCGWGDVLFFSPVNPAALLEVIRASGRDVPPVRFWKLSASALDPVSSRVMHTRPWRNGVFEPHAPEDIDPFTPDVLASVSQPSEPSLDRLRTLPHTAPLILWSDVPHVLYRGTLPISALSEVRLSVKSPAPGW